MSVYVLRLFEDRLCPGSSTAPLASHSRVVYVAEGSVKVRDGTPPCDLATGHAWFGAQAASFSATGTRARVWRWELSRPDHLADGLVHGEGVTSALRLAAEVVLDPAVSYLLRCDRVDFPPGGIAYTHIHWGPGIRCLLHGALTVRAGGSERTYRPGDPWFERGPEPVYATASPTDPSSFVRVMVIPVAIRGQTSIRYLLPEDRDRPKPQQYTRYVDEPIEL